MFKDSLFKESNLSEINIEPSSSKLIRCLSNNESIFGDNNIPFSTSNLSSSFDSDQETI